LNLSLIRAPDMEFSIELFTHYMFSYGESGFGKLYDFRGYEIFFWGFALFAIVVARKSVSKAKDSFSRNVLYPMILVNALLIFSTIPYTTGRSYSAQIWASCGIYAILTFSCLFKFFKENEWFDTTANWNSNGSNVLITISIIFTICSGLLNPFHLNQEFERLNSKSAVTTTSALLHSEANLIKEIVRSEDMISNQIGLLVPFGNNMSISLGIKNGLFVNHPTSVIYVEQMNFICKRNLELGRKWLILDSYLEDLFNKSKECLTHFHKPRQVTPEFLVTSRKQQISSSNSQ
jgi:hypothetical protein